jgi:predicted nucleotidyltransferase
LASLTGFLPARKDDKEIIGEQGEAKQMIAVHGPINRETMQAITRLIVESFDPEKVILFGSHARGEAGAHSDLDLLVVIRTDATQFRRGNPIRRAIAERFVLPVDVIVRSPEHLAEHGRNPKSALYKVLAEGEVLYERNAA